MFIIKMVKLKTLKDLELCCIPKDIDTACKHAHHVLKAEAIKWIKFWRSEHYDIKTHSHTLGKISSTLIFFNITEEDLK